MNKVFQEEERRIDLASIRKIDNNISHILDKTDNVAFYRFDGKAWVSLRFFIHISDIFGMWACPLRFFNLFNIYHSKHKY